MYKARNNGPRSGFLADIDLLKGSLAIQVKARLALATHLDIQTVRVRMLLDWNSR